MNYWDSIGRWINTLLLFIVGVIAFDTLFRMLEAQQSNVIVGTVRLLAAIVLLPFQGMFSDSRYELTALVAVLGYAMLVGIALSVLRGLQATRPVRQPGDDTPQPPVRPARPPASQRATSQAATSQRATSQAATSQRATSQGGSAQRTARQRADADKRRAPATRTRPVESTSGASRPGPDSAASSNGATSATDGGAVPQRAGAVANHGGKARTEGPRAPATDKASSRDTEATTSDGSD